MTHNLPSAVLVAPLKSIPPGTTILDGVLSNKPPNGLLSFETENEFTLLGENCGELLSVNEFEEENDDPVNPPDIEFELNGDPVELLSLKESKEVVDEIGKTLALSEMNCVELISGKVFEEGNNDPVNPPDIEFESKED